MCTPARKGVGGVECVDGHGVARGVLRRGCCALVGLSIRILSLAPVDQILEGRKNGSQHRMSKKWVSKKQISRGCLSCQRYTRRLPTCQQHCFQRRDGVNNGNADKPMN